MKISIGYLVTMCLDKYQEMNLKYCVYYSFMFILSLVFTIDFFSKGILKLIY